MRCLSSSNDPIAVHLYDTDNLMILGRGFEPSKLEPGDVVVVSPDKTRLDPEIVSANRLFLNFPTLKVDETPYERLAPDFWSSAISTSASGELSSILTGDVEGTKVQAVFERVSSGKFKVALLGAILSSIPVIDLDSHAASLTPSEDGMHFIREKKKLMVVTGTLVVTSAAIEFEGKVATDLFADADVTGLATAGLSTKFDTSNERAVRLLPRHEKMVIAIRCVELVFDGARFKKLRRPARPIANIRGERTSDQKFEMVKREDLVGDGGLFVYLTD